MDMNPDRHISTKDIQEAVDELKTDRPQVVMTMPDPYNMHEISGATNREQRRRAERDRRSSRRKKARKARYS